MFVILAYDVGVKRVARMRKIAEKYLRPVQKSVFEGHLTERLLSKLQKEIAELIDCECDAVIIYKQDYHMEIIKLEIGKRQESL